jgi:cation diffusion facilitator CzcD-associated flavoprotein CzcO
VIGAPAFSALRTLWAREVGHSVRLLEQADGVGGVWYWNRHPVAVLDSESYTDGYLSPKSSSMNNIGNHTSPRNPNRSAI